MDARLPGMLAGILALAACTSTAPAVPHPEARATARPHVTITARPAPTPKPSAPPAHVALTHVYASDGSRITVAVFEGSVRYVLHNGGSITGSERRALLAAFNGGFKLSAGAGGYMQDGHTASPILRGYASLIIYRSGQARIAVWPAGSAGAYSVRQNLAPLVLHGKPTAAASDWSLWGATLGGGAYVARSALGEDSSGDLIYAASMSAVPIDLADALVRFGARTGMELDINPAWVQLDVASGPGGTPRAAVQGQQRPADQYLTGWSRDFIAVLANF
jgi:hypothetical protein